MKYLDGVLRSSRQRRAPRGSAVDTPERRRVERFVRGQQEIYNGNGPKWEYCAADDEVYHESSPSAPYQEPASQYPQLDNHDGPLGGSDRYTGPKDSNRHGSRHDEYYGTARHDRYVSAPVRSPEQDYVPTRHDEHYHMPAQFDERDRFIPVRYNEADYVPGWFDNRYGEVVSIRYSKDCHIDAPRDEYGNSIPVRFGGKDFHPSEGESSGYGILLMVRYHGEDLLGPRQYEPDYFPLPITPAADTHQRLLEAPSHRGGHGSYHASPPMNAN